MLKRLMIPILMAALAIPLIARAGSTAGEHAAQRKLAVGKELRLNALRKALNLTPDQVSNLKSLAESNRAQRQAIAQDARQKRAALRDLMQQSNPDPSDVGNAVLALKQVRSQAQQNRDALLATFKNSLTPDQQKTLETLQSVRKNIRKKG